MKGTTGPGSGTNTYVIGNKLTTKHSKKKHGSCTHIVRKR